MNDASASAPAPNAERLAEEIFTGLRSTLEIFAVDIGVRRGLYEALAAHGPMTPRDLSKTAGIHARYAREWLEQQAVAGVLTVSGPADEDHAYERRFELPAEHRRVLLDREDPLYLATGPQFVASIADALPEVLKAFGTGGGVPYERYGPGTRDGIAGLNRPMFKPETLQSWVAALPDVHRRLTDGPDARVLDLGCGLGWSTIALARAFPRARLTGIDLDAASVEQARRNAGEAGLGEQVAFVNTNAAGAGLDGVVDLVTVFEALHDMADPIGALVSVRRLLAPSGAVLIGDEKVSEEFTAPGPELDRLNYAFSLLHCLPATRAEGAKVEAGTVLRPDTVRAYAREAGYGSVEVLDVEHDLWRFYRLSP
ncbi:methyltransferase domain-containing protein [Streptomyces sp. HC44]|uniref:Methyltransferase domain-containing protein n=1 Tax=Streptomyces scabichelini TaxID=2711217 RepID=A0A6G4VL18_9ACTN|nr:class I SAM-dependent methyltransferase [Streptomyces scabichelini]NGO14473.1 methyltransferase domain-containing protein [Streptomyces scabichelini]